MDDFYYEDVVLEEDVEYTEGEEDEDDNYIPPIPNRSRTRVSLNPTHPNIIGEPHVEELQDEEDEDEETEEEDEDEEEEEEGEEEEAGTFVDVSSNAVELVDELEERCQTNKGESCSKKRTERDESGNCGDSIGNEGDSVCCSICMEPWSSEGYHQLSCLPCGHLYGLSCIKKWIQQCKGRYSKCPQCSRRCTQKDIIKLYVTRLAVTDGEQQKKCLSLQAENEFLKMKIESLKERIQQDKEERVNNVKEKTAEQCAILAPPYKIELQDELIVYGGRVFDMDMSNQVLLLARRLGGLGGSHVLSKISLMYPYESETISLPPSTRAVRDIRASPSGRVALFAALGKKVSIVSMESNNIVLSYDLPAPAWSCSWDLNSQYHIYAGLQNGMVMVFDMRQTSKPMESMNGLTTHPVHTIHSLAHNSALPGGGGRTILSASPTGPCVWRTGDSGERPLLIPGMENQGICVSLAYNPTSDDIVATYRPKVQMSNEPDSSQLQFSSSPSIHGQAVPGSHFHIKRLGGSHYQNMGLASANVNDIRMSKSTIINTPNENPLFVHGDEVTRGLNLWELPSLRTVQNLQPNSNPIFDVKYASNTSSPGKGLLGCVSDDKLQLFSVQF